MEEVQGRVTVAPPVLTTIVRQTTLEEKGVSHLAPLPAKMRGLRAGAALEEGILVGVREQGVYVEVHVVAEPGVHVLKLGTAVQSAVTRAVEEMVGMRVVAVDVHIDDVARPVPQPIPLAE
jgi:uncharacterized alkaline shock family protein YloU